MTTLSNHELLTALDTRITKLERQLQSLRRARFEIASLEELSPSRPPPLLLANSFPPSPSQPLDKKLPGQSGALFDSVAEILQAEARTILEIAKLLKKRFPRRSLQSLRTGVGSVLSLAFARLPTRRTLDRARWKRWQAVGEHSITRVAPWHQLSRLGRLRSSGVGI